MADIANVRVNVRIFMAGNPAPPIWRIRLLAYVARLLRVPLDVDTKPTGGTPT